MTMVLLLFTLRRCMLSRTDAWHSVYYSTVVRMQIGMQYMKLYRCNASIHCIVIDGREWE